MKFASHIFKAYDIRGLVEGELSEEFAYRIGRAFVHYIKSLGKPLDGKSLVVGYDMRPTSPGYTAEVIRGIRDEGMNVVDIGMCSTPLFNFACAFYPNHAGGIMITASHNPAEYNGFKMTLEDGLPVSGKNEVLVQAAQEADFSKRAENANSTTVTKMNPLVDYFAKIFSIVDPKTIKPLKIVIDAGNGMAEASFPELVKNLPIEVEFMYLTPDGTFPNHEANPLKVETLEALQKRVVEVGADFGFALDGDCDRVGLVDERGEVVDASFVGTLIAREVLKKHPGGLVFKDPRMSMVFDDVCSRLGARVEMCKVGHANIKKVMKEKGGVFGAELSEHLFFKDVFDVECSDLCFLYVLEIVSRENKPLSEIIAPFKKYFHSGEINFEVHKKDEIMVEIEQKYKAEAIEVSHIDGLWMKFDWGWVSVRASNTEPVLRLNLEAATKEMMEEKVKEFSELIHD